MIEKKREKTIVCHQGLSFREHQGIINPPVYHASTILFPDVATLKERVEDPSTGLYYGRYGTPTIRALEEVLVKLERGRDAIITSSGLSAITMSLMALTSSGVHILISDSVYHPTRKFIDSFSKRFGVEVTFFDPRIGRRIVDLIRVNTRVIFLESPGSLTFEVQDVPGIVEAVRGAERTLKSREGIVVMMDNTWATPLFFKPLDLGVNVSIHSATKYLGGHSDLMLGIIVVDGEYALELREGVQSFGMCGAPDDVYLCLRGLRTLSVRLQQHQQQALALAEYFLHRPEVDRVLYPALPQSEDYGLWRRDYLGASGLFSIVLKRCSSSAVSAFIDHLELFGIGFSWGGFESLALPVQPYRTAVPWPQEEQVIRIHAGLEDIDDLIRDLENGWRYFHLA